MESGHMTQRVFVTGGAGFIGSAFIRFLVGEMGLTALNFDKLTYAANLASLAEVADHPRYTFVQGDICDRQRVRAAFQEFQPDIVMHLAAESHVDRSIDGPAPFIDTNVVGTFILLQEALEYWRKLPSKRRDAFRFHHVSSDEVFGSLAAMGLFDDTTQYDPSSPYAASKAAADHMVRAWHRTYRLPVTLSNCSNNYGPYQFPEKLIPLMIIKALAGEPLPVYGVGENIRDWLYVEDHARALWLIATRGEIGKTYLIGARAEQRNIDVVRMICRILDNMVPDAGGVRERLITFVVDRPGHDQRYAINPSRLFQELGWSPRESFETGLRRTIAWYLNRSDWWKPLVSNVYRGERLGRAS
jgi:dTDP-glucose 4,6-dehydratase